MRTTKHNRRQSVHQSAADQPDRICPRVIWPKLAEYNRLDAKDRASWLAEHQIPVDNEELLRVVTKSHFVVPDSTRYECQRCGECCRYAKKVATFTYEPCLFLDEHNQCSKHAGRYQVCKWFPFWLFNAGPWGPLLTIKPYCTGYGKGGVVDYVATIKRLCALAKDETEEADGAFVIHEVIYLPKQGEWVFPSRQNVDSLVALMSEAAVESAKQHREARELEHPGQLHWAHHYTSGLLGALTDPQVTVTQAGIVTDLNVAFEDLCRTCRQAIVGQPLMRLFAQADSLEKDLRRCFAKGRLAGAAHKLSVAPGSRVPVLVNALVFRDRADGLVHEALVCLSSISEVVYAELTQSRNYARGLLEACMDALLVVGLDGTVNDINEAVVSLTGKARDEILGARFESFFDSPAQARRGVELALADGSVRNYELVVVAASGARIPVSFNASPYRDSDGTLQGIFAIARDLRP